MCRREECIKPDASIYLKAEEASRYKDSRSGESVSDNVGYGEGSGTLASISKIVE